MAFIDYYKILGIDKSTPQKDVKKAYLKRAKQFHPDLHPDDPKAKAKFQALTEAYDVIGDPDKRAKYDQYGEHWKEAGQQFGGSGGFGKGSGGGNPFEGFDFSGFGTGGGGFSSFFEELFGRRGKQGGGFGGFTGFGGSGQQGGTSGFGGARTSPFGGRQNTGEMNANVSIDLYTALLGGEVMITLSNGSRVKLKIKPETQPGTKVRLRGKGYDRGDGTFGDLIITYQVKLPTGLTERQRQLLREMQYAK